MKGRPWRGLRGIARAAQAATRRALRFQVDKEIMPPQTSHLPIGEEMHHITWTGTLGLRTHPLAGSCSISRPGILASYTYPMNRKCTVTWAGTIASALAHWLGNACSAGRHSLRAAGEKAGCQVLRSARQ